MAEVALIHVYFVVHVRLGRLKSAKDVYNEMLELYIKYECTQFIFEHDSLTANQEMFIDYLNELVNLNKYNFKWSCSSRLDTIPIECLDLIKSAGCTHIYFGIETGSKRMQKILNKNLNVDNIKYKLKEISNNNINFTASFVYGHPEENCYDLNKTLELALFCKNLKTCVSVQFHKLSPVNGSYLYEKWKDKIIYDGIISDQAKT